MTRIHPVLLSIISGLLLWISWPASALTAVVMLAFVPLLIVAEYDISFKQFIGHSFLALLVWNAGSTWWIWNSTSVGSVAAIAANALLMTVPWIGYFIIRRTLGRWTGYCALVSFWMAFEFIHLNWQLSWPWLSIGNVFAVQTDWVQWYEYTGVAGGTLWVLVVNLLIFHWLFWKRDTNRATFGKTIGIAAAILVPIVISYLHLTVKPGRKITGNGVVIVQPNIDPYGKFNPSSVPEQIDTHLQLTASAIDSSTRLVVWPETALSANVDINDIRTAPVYRPVFEFLKQHPQLTLQTGIETYRLYGLEKPESPYARRLGDGTWYDSYNAAVSIREGAPLQFYVKSKLVPGVETLPSFLNFLGPVFEKFGGTTGGYARDSAAVVFKNSNGFQTAPIICYESIYGEYVAGYVAKGANLLTIMTNDGWWGNTPGHKQHLHYARLRAVETRRWVLRSANTGISAVIDPYGNIVQSRPWDQAAVIKMTVPAASAVSFYVRHGDYMYRFFLLLAGLLVLWNLVKAAQKQFGRTR